LVAVGQMDNFPGDVPFPQRGQDHLGVVGLVFDQ
jgi:hypothetical protein